MSGISAVQMGVTDQPAQFRIPEFLRQDDPRSRRWDTEPVGVGIVWLGLALIAVPAATSNLSPISIGAWIAGVALVIGGIARARQDGIAMLRAGALTSVAGIVIMAIIANEVISSRVPEDQDPAPAIALVDEADEQSEEPSTESAEDNAPTLTGKVPMLRGSSAHDGQHPGPAIDGNPYRLWRYDAGDDLRSTPAIANGSAYFGTKDGYLIALDLLTGLPQWRFDLGGYPVTSSPAVVDRTVYIGSGYAVYAIDEERGTELWRFPMSYAGESSPTVAGGVVYVASKEHNLYALDAETGERLWSYRTDGLLFGSPSLSEDKVLIGGDDGDIFAIDRDSGIVRWKYTAPSGIYSSIAIRGDTTYITLRDKSVIALDLETGEAVWSYPIGGEASPAVTEGEVYIGSDDGALYVLDSADGGPPKWLFPTGNGVVLSPVIVGDTVYIASGPTLFALDRTTGAELWRYPIGEVATTEPVIVDGIAYIGAEDGNLYAITGDAGMATPEAT
jgi:outer membrane protein assembly factor BamB